MHCLLWDLVLLESEVETGALSFKATPCRLHCSSQQPEPSRQPAGCTGLQGLCAGLRGTRCLFVPPLATSVCGTMRKQWSQSESQSHGGTDLLQRKGRQAPLADQGCSRDPLKRIRAPDWVAEPVRSAPPPARRLRPALRRRSKAPLSLPAAGSRPPRSMATSCCCGSRTRSRCCQYTLERWDLGALAHGDHGDVCLALPALGVRCHLQLAPPHA